MTRDADKKFSCSVPARTEVISSLFQTIKHCAIRHPKEHADCDMNVTEVQKPLVQLTSLKASAGAPDGQTSQHTR